MAEPGAVQDEVVVDVRRLRFSYKNRVALRDISFTVARKSLHGFVGPNGAGKTTTLKILATLLRANPGACRVFDHDISTNYRMVRRRIGFMPDTLSMYRQMTVFECLDFFAAAYGLSLDQRDQTIKDVLALTDMTSRQHDLIRNLSRGMQQRVSLARALVHDPDLLLLDEPAAGLDPRARIELLEMLRELRRIGKTIFISSHILAELATLCDAVTIIDRGRIKYTGSLTGLLTEEGETAAYVLSLDADHPPLADALRTTAGITDVARLDEQVAYRVTFRKDKLSTNDILQAAIAAGARVVAFQRDTRQLNDAFMALTEPGGPE